MNYLEAVEQFHKTYDHPIEKSPTIPSKERCELRVSLLEEELKELKQAISDGDKPEILDALCDLQYVLSGAILEFGMKDIFDDAFFNEVQRSNMSKTVSTEEEAIASVEKNKVEKGYDAYYVEKEPGLFLIYRKGDNKVLKGVHFEEPDFSRFVK